MPASADQKDIVRYAMTVAGPGHDGRMRPGDEGAIVAMQIDRNAAERLAPVGDRAIVMRVRDGDCLQAAERADIVDGFAGDQRHAIPHHAAIRLAAPEARAVRSQKPAQWQCRGCRDRRARRACDRCAICSRVSHDWPFQFTNCRSSSQIRQACGGSVLSGNWAPHCSHVHSGMAVAPVQGRITLSGSDPHSICRSAGRSTPFHHVSLKGRISISKVQALRGCS